MGTLSREAFGWPDWLLHSHPHSWTVPPLSSCPSQPPQLRERRAWWGYSRPCSDGLRYRHLQRDEIISLERRNPISSNCANELNKLLVEQPTTEKKKGINCSHNGNDSRKSGEEKINRGALEPEKEKDPFILCAWHKREHKDILCHHLELCFFIKTSGLKSDMTFRVMGPNPRNTISTVF